MIISDWIRNRVWPSPEAVPAPPRWGSEPGVYGDALPFVVGTARVRAQLVYHGASGGPVEAFFHDGSAWQAIRRLWADAVYAVCEAPVTDFKRIWKGPTPSAGLVAAVWDRLYYAASGSYQKIVSDSGVTAWAQYVGTAAEGMGHQGTAHLRIKQVILDDNNRPPDLDFEVQGYNAGAGGESTDDAHPADVLVYLLTNAKNGLGLSAGVVNVDTGIGGTAADSYRRYCSARGWYVSRAFDRRTPILDLIASLLVSTDSTLVLIDGVLTAVPFCDQTITRSTFTFTPTLTATVIDAAELIHEDEDPPINVERVQAKDVYGVWPVTYFDRTKDYEKVTREYLDPIWTQRHGTRRAPVIDLGWVLSETHAFWVTHALAQRAIYQRNRYTFRLGMRWCLLTPMDFLSLSEPLLGLSGLTVRILSTEENEDGSITVEAIEWPSAVAEPIDLTQQGADGLLTTNVRRADAPSALLGDSVAPGQIPISLLSYSQLDTDNLWPNPSSEIAPPAGADTTQAEWTDRVNAGAGAYSGSWVRQVTAAVSGFWMPCSPGAQFYAEAQAKRTAGTGSGGRLNVAFYPTLGSLSGVLGTTSGSYSTSGSWTKVSVSSAAAPAGANAAYISYEAATGDTVQFDALYARRVVQTDVLADSVVTSPKIAQGEFTVSQVLQTYGANLFPNGTSEVAPPASAPTWVLSTPEFQSRSASAAYEGSYGRDVNGIGGDVSLGPEYPCAPGDTFTLSAYGKYVTGTAAKLQIFFLVSGSWTLGADVSVTASWARHTVIAKAPANTTRVALQLRAISTRAYFDLIEAYRVLTPGMAFVAVNSSGTKTASAGDDGSITTSQVATGHFRISHASITASAICVATLANDTTPEFTFLSVNPNAGGYVDIYVTDAGPTPINVALHAWLVLQ